MKFLIFMITLFITTNIYAENAPFIYNDHGKRDPLIPLISPTGVIASSEDDMTVNDLSLQGIVADAQGNNVAIVNGKMVKPHDKVGPYTIDVVAVDHVELLKGSERSQLNLKKGGT